MGKHDLRAKELQVQEIINAIRENPVLIMSLLRYNEQYAFDNDLDIPSVLRVKSLVEEGGSGKIEEVYTEADLVEESYGGVWYLPVIIPEDSTPVNARVDQAEFTTFKGPGNWSVVDGGFVVSGFDSNLPQTITLTYI